MDGWAVDGMDAVAAARLRNKETLEGGAAAACQNQGHGCPVASPATPVIWPHRNNTSRQLFQSYGAGLLLHSPPLLWLLCRAASALVPSLHVWAGGLHGTRLSNRSLCGSLFEKGFAVPPAVSGVDPLDGQLSHGIKKER